MTIRLTKSMNDLHGLRNFTGTKSIEHFKTIQKKIFENLIKKYPITFLYFQNRILKKTDRIKHIQYFFNKTRTF